MRFERADRRRVAIASALTLVALPATWLANDDASSERGAAPNVAAVGVEAAGAAPEPTTPEATTPDDPLTASGDTSPPPFLAGPTAASSSRQVVVARPTAEGQSVLLDATFRRAVSSGVCEANRVPDETEVTVVNLENGRSVRCVVVPLASGSFEEIALAPVDFQVIADVIEAPVRVEITW